MSDKITGAIQEAKMSKSGKTLGIMVNGDWYYTKQFHWQSQIGVNITFKGSYVSVGDGGMTWANDIVMTDAPGPQSQAPSNYDQAPTPPIQNAAPQPPATSQQSPPQRDPVIYLPMTSNLVAHAIQVGLIKEPGDIKPWAVAAFRAAKQRIELPDEDVFEEDIPY